mgnify:CR=1 FL=1
MRVLLTGGCGFIGSHACVVLLEAGYDVVIVDSFHNSSRKVVDKITEILLLKEFKNQNRLIIRKGDIRNLEFLEDVFSEFKAKSDPIISVIHFAGLKSVSDSVQNPIEYWDVNVKGSFNLVSIMEKFCCFNLVFSSSCTIYGQSDNDLISENEPTNPINPYGFTKATVEQMLTDLTGKFNNKWKIACLRYFNPIGAHHTGLIGENPMNEPTNLFPIICDVALGKRDLVNVFGDDWPTQDGTCIRDYIHVMDLADAHLYTMKFLFSNNESILKINLGTGVGYSVLDLIKELERQSKKSIKFKITSRREGDACRAVADPSLAKKILGWSTQRSLAKMCQDGWMWQTINPNGLV